MIENQEKIIVIDTETTNSIDDPICYDVGFAVIDKNGFVFEKHSFVVAEVFLDEDLMRSAYFIEKENWQSFLQFVLNLLRFVKNIKSKLFALIMPVLTIAR